MSAVKDELLQKIKTAATANLPRTQTDSPSETKRHSAVFKTSEKIITIAASTGGPPAIKHVLGSLPSETPPILLVQHMPKGVTALFAQTLNQTSKFAVKEAQEGITSKKLGALLLGIPYGCY